MTSGKSKIVETVRSGCQGQGKGGMDRENSVIIILKSKVIFLKQRRMFIE